MGTNPALKPGIRAKAVPTLVKIRKKPKRLSVRSSSSISAYYSQLSPALPYNNH
jgi:hypothetical protein